MIGVVSISEAMSMAVRAGLDLVEISPNAEPPVCRVMDFGKFKYEMSRKDREARKHQHAAEMKEIKFHANVADHDFMTKVNHIRGFLEKGMKVKCSLFFRGRENAHREIGFDVMNRLVKATEDIGQTDAMPKLIGNSIMMVLSQRTTKLSGKSERDGLGSPLSGIQVPVASPKPVSAAQVGSNGLSGSNSSVR
jgi:translation initiation factor IF-3